MLDRHGLHHKSFVRSGATFENLEQV